MTLVSVFQVSNFMSYSHYKIKGPYEKKKRFRPGGHCHMNSQIMENVIQYYLHVYDSALRIYSQKKSEYQTIFTAIGHEKIPSTATAKLPLNPTKVYK